MLRQNGAPMATNHSTATVTTSATPDQPSFVHIGQKLAEPECSNRTHSMAIATKITSRGRRPQYKNNMVPKSHFGTMLRQNGAPTAADHATTTATTITTDGSSFVEFGPKLAEPGHTNRTHLDTSSAIARSRRPQNTSRVESYVENWYKNSTIPKTNTIDEKVL